ncbi:MAG TPA: sigma-70 family RNA polymerase sigma factor [Gemmatimonadaceae bacterium]|nr:sigma-70 family RNA polymerase sigma factor [Gemmatimonadaceae bacterium]
MARVLSLVRQQESVEAPRLAVGDEALVDRARKGDVDAFERVYRLYAGRVYALCLRLVADPVEARELTQDTFVRAWEALPRFRADASITTWLHRIAVNAMLERRRGDRRRSARVSLVDDDEDGEAQIAGVVTAPDVATAIDLERAIGALPPGVRRAFVLHDVEGYTHEEIATMTGLAAGTLRAQLHRARQLLKRALSL